MDREELIREIIESVRGYLASHASKPSEDDPPNRHDPAEENAVAAGIAIDAVLEAREAGAATDAGFIDAVADRIHAVWLERNRDTATREQLSDFANLPEEEKEKDRIFVRAAIDAAEGL